MRCAAGRSGSSRGRPAAVAGDTPLVSKADPAGELLKPPKTMWPTGQGGVVAVASLPASTLAEPETSVSSGFLLSPAVGDRGQLAAEPAEGAAGDAPGLVGDRARLGDVVAAARREVGALEAAAEQLPAPRAGGDRGLRLPGVDVDGRVGRGDVLLLAGAGDLQGDVARRGATRVRGRRARRCCGSRAGRRAARRSAGRPLAVGARAAGSWSSRRPGARGRPGQRTVRRRFAFAPPRLKVLCL